MEEKAVTCLSPKHHHVQIFLVVLVEVLRSTRCPKSVQQKNNENEDVLGCFPVMTEIQHTLQLGSGKSTEKKDII